jgi:hypothetical protein
LARELVQLGGDNSYTLFFSKDVHPDFRELQDKFRPVCIPLKGEFSGKQILMVALCNSRPIDLIHFPAFPPPLACVRPMVWTLHDATPWQYPETMDIKGRLYFQWFGGRAVRSSRLIGFTRLEREAQPNPPTASGEDKNHLQRYSTRRSSKRYQISV